MSEELDVLVRLAKIGIRALVEEATGYQEQRAPDDLRQRYAELGGDESDYIAPDSIPEATS